MPAFMKLAEFGFFKLILLLGWGRTATYQMACHKADLMTCTFFCKNILRDGFTSNINSLTQN